MRSSGLHGRRPELDETLWFWNALASLREGEFFELSTSPQNVTREHSAGFAFEPSAIRHRSDGARQHVLGFFVPGREGGWNVGRAIAACREQLQEAAIWPNIKAYGEASFERRALLWQKVEAPKD